MYIYLYIYIHIHTYTYIYIYIHIYMYMCICVSLFHIHTERLLPMQDTSHLSNKRNLISPSLFLVAGPYGAIIVAQLPKHCHAPTRCQVDRVEFTAVLFLYPSYQRYVMYYYCVCILTVLLNTL